MNTFAIVRNTVNILKIDWERDFLKVVRKKNQFFYNMSVIEDEERKNYYEAFSAFDWNNNGKISYKSLLSAMRRAGVNPTEVEVHDIINRLDNGTGVLSFDDFLKVKSSTNLLLDIYCIVI